MTIDNWKVWNWLRLTLPQQNRFKSLKTEWDYGQCSKLERKTWKLGEITINVTK